MRIRNVAIGLAVSALVAGVVVSCGGGGGGSGGGTPAVASGTGRGAVVVDTGTGEITGSVFFSGMSGTPTSVGIFAAPSGQNANPATPIIVMDVTSGGATVPASSSLSAGQVTSLQANGLYFLVKTSTFPNGELRGQIDTTTGMTAGLGSLDNGQEVPATVSGATGRGTVVVDSTTGQIIAGVVTYTGLTTNAILTHIHQGAAGVNGNIRVNFSPATATAGTATVTDPSTGMTSGDLTDLGAGNMYFNVHTGMYGGGEIRGQVAITTTQDVRSASLTTGQVVP
jgi:hypothetical protein